MTDRPVHHLFSCGTLRIPAVQLARFGRLLDGRPDALVPPDSDDAVEGQVFAISDVELAAADTYEADGHARVETTLRSGIRAWVYLDRTSGKPLGVREWLRGLEVFAGPLSDFDPADAPAEPVDLFLGWLHEAVAAGVPDAHAMTLSTVGEDGHPDARVLILKNVDHDGWQFAVHAGSPKGRQLADRPSAALTFYWPPQGRQVRVRGGVEPAPPGHSAADLLARSPAARAEVLLGRQSDPVDSRAARDDAFRTALARIEAEPGLVSPQWTLYTLVPGQIEFWQADKDRLHNRLRYTRPDRHTAWEHHVLWP
ncbi:pyridoxal 5'-phosphate synthase [Streptomyces sp. HNM1019]|uniref:pyridoxal 5'-phosphate synthase n=1 Tax=Streptomyces sp. HNM1019 TaxID=3424717 RepID=UPI003D7700D5